MKTNLKLTGLSTFSSAVCRIRGVSTTVKKDEVAAFHPEVAAILSAAGRKVGPEGTYVPNWTEMPADAKIDHDFSDLPPPKRRLSRMEELAAANAARQNGGDSKPQSTEPTDSKPEGDATDTGDDTNPDGPTGNDVAGDDPAPPPAEAPAPAPVPAPAEAPAPAPVAQRSAAVKRSAPVKRAK